VASFYSFVFIQAMFGDEPRFGKDVQIVKGQLCGFKKAETDKNLGPGSYFAPTNDEKRNGWVNKSFSKKEPMASGDSSDSRYSYQNGLVTSSGLAALPGTPQSRQGPGPGAYGDSDPPNTISHQLSVDSLNSKSSYMGGTTPRLLSPTAVMKGDVIFQCIPKSTVGPGAYDSPEDTIVKRSHNARINSNTRSMKAGSPSKGSPRPLSSTTSSNDSSPRKSPGSGSGSNGNYSPRTVEQTTPQADRHIRSSDTTPQADSVESTAEK